MFRRVGPPFICRYFLSFPLQPQFTPRLRGDTPWPFDLVMKRAGVQSTQGQLRTFKPRNALVILKSTLPRLLVDVQSTRADDAPPELARILLEGAAIVRFANISLDTFNAKKDFILVAVFIWQDGRVFQYSLFQRQHDNSVRCSLYTSEHTG